MDKFALVIPESRPLRAGGHLVIREHRAHIGERILKHIRRGEVTEVRAVRRKLELTKDRVGIRRHITFEDNFDDRRDEWSRRDRCGISSRRRVGNGGTESDRWRKRDRWT